MAHFCPGEHFLLLHVHVRVPFASAAQLEMVSPPCGTVINLRCACAARVTVLGLSVSLSTTILAL